MTKLNRLKAVSVLTLLLYCSIAIPANAQMKQPAQQSAPVPYRVEIGPTSPPETMIVLAVGAATVLDFGDEKPINFVAGLREKLGVQTSDETFPGNAIYLRPSLEMAGITTNISVETTHGRASFFVKTILNPQGAKPGEFTGEVRIRTAGYLAEMKRLKDEVAALKKDFAEAEAAKKEAEAAKTATQEKATKAFSEGQRNGVETGLASLLALPLEPKEKTHRLSADRNTSILRLAVAKTKGGYIGWYEVINTGPTAQTINTVEVKGGQAVMAATAREILPREKARVLVYVMGEASYDTVVFTVSGTPIRSAFAINRERSSK